MLECRMHTVPRDDGRVEWRVAPRGEPLASCRWPWPAGWRAEAPPWVPPGLGRRAWLCRLAHGAGTLDVWVMRFGAEVDGLAALQATIDRPLSAIRWAGLVVAEARDGDDHWAVVHAGPAVFALRASGAAVAHLPAAARGFASLLDDPPVAEPLESFAVGPLRTRRLAAWRASKGPAAPHAHSRAILTLDGPTSTLARIEALVIDCRILVGHDPHAALAAADARLEWLGVEGKAERGALDGGPSGPARVREVVLRGPRDSAPGWHRRTVRRIGRGLIVLDGLWRRDTPLVRLAGRRHQDILLALGECP